MNTKKDSFFFIPVNESDEHIRALYNLLEERLHNISHNELPSFDKHKLFVLNNPYREWFIVQKKMDVIGTIYILDNNCIGINIQTEDKIAVQKSIQWILDNFEPLPEIKSVRNKNFHISIHPDNKIMFDVLSKFNSSLVEHTYIIK